VEPVSEAFTARRPARTPPALIAATAVFGAIVVLAVAVVGMNWRRDHAAAARQGWTARLVAVFRPPTEGLSNVLTGLQEWRSGAKASPEMARELDGAIAAYSPLPHNVEALPPHEARPRYAAAARLYLEFLRLERAAADLPAGPLRAQADLMARRVNLLADRVFDRGRVAADPSVFDQPPPGEGEIRFPNDVPDWAAEGLAAGPPLADDPPASPVGDRPVRRSRPQQTEAGWRQALAQAGIPSSAEVQRAITARHAPALAQLAAAFEAGAGRLHQAADPRNGRERAATLVLGVLVQGEAARAALADVAAGAVPGPLDASARRLAAVGAALRSVAADPSA